MCLHQLCKDFIGATDVSPVPPLVTPIAVPAQVPAWTVANSTSSNAEPLSLNWNLLLEESYTTRTSTFTHFEYHGLHL